MQMKMFENDFFTIIKDTECTENTPVKLGVKDKFIYGSQLKIKPRILGKCLTAYQKKYYLPELLPLEDYDKIIVLFSGGKDSAAVYFKLIEMGVPKEKIELWHHDIDGGHPTRKMDWPVTKNYVKAFAKATETTLRLSWRVNGFWGEVYRVGASDPIQYVDGEKVKTCNLSKLQKQSQELKKNLSNFNELKKFGYRMKFPAKSGDLNVRWCSAYLKIMVGDAVIRNLEQFKPSEKNAKTNTKILVLSGERRGESIGRSKYNEMEIHRTNALARNKRLVHWWRPVIDYSERDIWEVMKRNKCNPHPCYRVGWNRCSCMMCVFSLPKHWQGIKELYPECFQEICNDEKILGFTLNNHQTLEEYVAGTKSCLIKTDIEAMRQLKTSEFRPKEIFVSKKWIYPIGAFKGSSGGPC